ncbi:MAG: HesA/MoeB/ThiF family protein [Lachnospiraceae bacterium]|jgi:adenylyltransferase/sulfurtransferase|nr:HesA/MoeB/ThiF family protein [Lachnospiraceae bacterium]
MSEESRYSRQILLPQIGEQGQKRLAESTAAVIGCGGLGAPVLTSLALAGVGKLRLIDHDRIGLSNLNRQFLYEESELDKEKCERAADFLRRRNSGIVLETVCERLTEENARRLLSGVDVIVDCVDRVETRRHAGRAARRLSVPLVEGGVHGFYGFVLSVLPGKSACLECVTAQEAEERGPVPAVGAVAGVIGSLQAVECMKILLGLPHVLYGRMLQYDGLYGEFTEVPVHVRPDCICQS